MADSLRIPIVLGLLLGPMSAAGDDVSTAGDRLRPILVHLQKGRYEEGLEALESLPEQVQKRVEAVLLRSRLHQARGEWDKASEVIERALATNESSAALWARRAELAWRGGRLRDAQEAVEKALRLDAEQPLARLVRADLLTATGRIDEADEAYRWFVRFYNRRQPSDAETLLVVARGAAQYARWHGVASVFDFLVNELCPDALQDDPHCWRAYLVSGELLLEKFNRAEALPELNRALAINPRATEVLVALARAALQKGDLAEAQRYTERALAVDRRHVPALQVKAELLLAIGRLEEARRTILAARRENPLDERTLALLAACDWIQSGYPDVRALEGWLARFGEERVEEAGNPPAETGFEQLVQQLAAVNPRPGYFLTWLGELMEARRKFAVAEVLYKTAIRVMPQLAEPHTALGMLYSRTGRTEEAKRLLDGAFRKDPFHVRVSNMRKVLALLEEYDTVTTDHFVIRVDSAADRILAHYAAETLEASYARLVEQYGYEPPHRTQFEIYHNAKGLPAHQWFSARMIGLPWIRTVGASTGMIVALTSPTATDKPFNWARVLRHELVHVFNLQQTDFNIPYWLTEGLAVRNEGGVRPEVWNRLLLERVPRGGLTPIARLDEGFLRPTVPDDWQFAYCQSRLCVDYFTATYGEAALRTLLAAYRDGADTPRAIQQACGVSIDRFETGYQRYVKHIVADLERQMGIVTQPLEALRESVQRRPDDPQAVDRLVAGLMQRRRLDEARKLATQLNAAHPEQPFAAALLAQEALDAHRFAEAETFLEPALDEKRPHPNIVALLAAVRLQQGRRRDAERLLLLGLSTFPDDPQWARRLLQLAEASGDERLLRKALERLVEFDADDVSPRRRLAQLLFDAGEWKQAALFARRALNIDVEDVTSHRILAAASARLRKFDQAVQEYRTLLELDPDDDAARLELARHLMTLDRRDEARSHLEDLRRRQPQNPEVRELWERLSGGSSERP